MKQKCQDDDESVYDFARRRFGADVADTLITAMVYINMDAKTAYCCVANEGKREINESTF